MYCAIVVFYNAMMSYTVRALRLVQKVLLLDDAELLERVMPFVRCLNNFILDETSLLKRKTVAYRLSRMTKQQVASITVGEGLGAVVTARDSFTLV